MYATRHARDDDAASFVNVSALIEYTNDFFRVYCNCTRDTPQSSGTNIVRRV